MPELPEVETVVRGLRGRLERRTIVETTLVKHDMLREVSPRQLTRHLAGATITRVMRRAKHAVIELDESMRLVFKPGMTGTLVYRRSGEPEARDAYSVLTLWLDDGNRVVYRDIRRIGSIWLMDPSTWSHYNEMLGPEPLAPEFSVELLMRRMRKTRQSIKKALMDQRLLAGVGNIYANEILFDAGISPRCRASSLRRPEYEAIHTSLRRTLEEAVRRQGTTLKDYRTSDDEPGEFQSVLRVYGRGGHPCLRCGGSLQTTHELDQRATTFCPRCQKCRVAPRRSS